MAKKVIHIHHAIDAAAAHHAAKEMAVRIGFGSQESEEIAIAVSELASNQFTHAQGGTIIIDALTGERPGIQVEAVDTGPGIADIEKALADGFSTAGGLGLGLGAVNRLMEVFDIVSQPGQGTQIRCQRWLHPVSQDRVLSPLDIGVATRPLPGMSVNGDTFIVKKWGEQALVGVIDGLGHGLLANQAAEAARQYVEAHTEQPLKALFSGTARACLATRGVVMALAHFDFGSAQHLPFGERASLPLREGSPLPSWEGAPRPPWEGAPLPLWEGAFSFASLGNIEARLLGSPEPAYFQLRRGVVGANNTPNVVVTEHRWRKECVLVLHSDGLITHWRPEDFPDIWSAPASVAAQQLLLSLGKEDDDATVVVVKNAKKDGIS